MKAQVLLLLQLFHFIKQNIYNLQAHMIGEKYM